MRYVRRVECRTRQGSPRWANSADVQVSAATAQSDSASAPSARNPTIHLQTTIPLLGYARFNGFAPNDNARAALTQPTSEAPGAEAQPLRHVKGRLAGWI